MAEPILRLEGLCKDYGEGLVLSGLSLDVYPGEFLTLLGPSGCGKTTTLRIIAGLERPTAGRVLIDGTDVTGLPPEKRPVNTVFQNYALFPHMTVFQNIAYGLKVLGISKSEQKERVMAALSLVRLAGFERRMPSQLSGGQRQRVAIARAVVLQPKVLLLDEPLGALDLKLRQEMQQELKSLQQKLGITFVYITHDQEEALNMSTRIVILNSGHPGGDLRTPAHTVRSGFYRAEQPAAGYGHVRNAGGPYVGSKRRVASRTAKRLLFTRRGRARSTVPASPAHPLWPRAAAPDGAQGHHSQQGVCGRDATYADRP